MTTLKGVHTDSDLQQEMKQASFIFRAANLVYKILSPIIQFFKQRIIMISFSSKSKEIVLTSYGYTELID